MELNKKQLNNLKNETLALINDAKSFEDLEDIRISLLGRQGKINQLTQEIPELPKEKRGQFGKLINSIKQNISSALKNKQALLEKKADQNQHQLDITRPGIKPPQGHLHIITQAIEEITTIFEKIGFVKVRYPEVEWDWYAFESLNMPKGHPARDEWETYFLDVPEHSEKGKMVLTPHTSSGQVREMERLGEPPVRMINIAKCYRRQQDVTHTTMFHQFEGLVIDKNINIAHLKGVTDYFAKTFYGPQRKTRLRPFNFEFTEPSFEVDINCPLCLGKGCKTCKSGWHELGGAGMVHPNVLKAGNIDPDKYTGFAFGWGVERTYLMRAGLEIDDLRTLYSNDIKFLKQF